MVKKSPDRVPPLRLIRALPHLPSNRETSKSLSVRRLPQITSRTSIAGLSAVRSAVRGLLGNLKPTFPPGRDERFRNLIVEAVGGAEVLRTIQQEHATDVRAVVLEAFGKPTRVEFDLVVYDPDDRLHPLREPVLAADLLYRAIRAVWDNPEMAPVAVRGRVVAVRRNPTADGGTWNRAHSDQSPDESVLLDARDAGFVEPLARAEDLYEHFGAPMSDPTWHP